MDAVDTSWYGRLDRGIILDAALRIAARPGVVEIRFRELGAELEADPTAVYRHFRNKAQLLSELIDRLMVDVTRSLPEGAPWRTVLEAMADATFETFTQHPAIGSRLVEARPVGPGELGLIEVSLRAFDEAGLRDAALVDHYGAFSGMLLSYVAAACRERIGAQAPRPDGGDEGTAWVPEADDAPVELTMLARYGERLAGLDFRSTYFAGVRVLLDAVERAGGGAPER